MRRHLHIGWADWKSLPWYEQKALRDGLLEEFAGQKTLGGEEGDAFLRDIGVQVN